MLSRHLPRAARLALYALASAILLVMCVLPQEKLPEVGASDKTEHAIAWFVLTLTGYGLSPRRTWAIPAYALAFGVAIELLQAYATVGRHGDVRDFAMDALGVAAGMAVFRLAPKSLRT